MSDKASVLEQKTREMGRLRRIKSRYHYFYSSGENIGCGTFASVKYCKRRSDGRDFAVKIISKHHLTDKELDGLKFEMRILKCLKHPHIIQMVDCYDDGTKVRMVLELCNGGDLFDKLLAAPNKHFDEDQCAQIVCIIARSLKYLHSHFIVHRDIKPENILFTTNGTLKITDFGLAHYLKLPPSQHIMHTCCGTPHYVAPEIIRGEEYTYKIDYWSLGVILYIMLSGMQPFKAKSLHIMYAKIRKGDYSFPSANWEDVSDEAKDLVCKLICVDADTRYDGDDVMMHEFVTNNVDLNEFHKNEKRLLDHQRNTKRKTAKHTNKSPKHRVPHEEHNKSISRNKILFFSIIFLLSALSQRGDNQMHCKWIRVLIRKCYRTFIHYSWNFKVWA